MAKNTNYIFMIGGVISGVGKGIATSSLAFLLKSRGFNVTAIKIDPYINVDAGTIRPTEHGEVFVTDDGKETDQDLGNYERFLNQDILATNYMTTGSVYLSVIQKERNLEYNGEDVEVVPHIPLEVIARIKNAALQADADFCLIEVGGTVGEYQNLIFLEAGRMMHLEIPACVFFILVSYLPIPAKVGEMKTKPTQHAARSLNEAGIQPDIILARAENPLDSARKEKISLFCNVPKDQVISAPDVDSIYEVPLNFEKDGLTDVVLKLAQVQSRKEDLKAWRELVLRIQTVKKPIRIGIVGKYFQTGDYILADSYISVIEAIKHASWQEELKPEIAWLNSEDYEHDKSKLSELSKYDGIIVPGGFGARGVEGKILAIQYAREHKIPYLGLCYGMQMAVIEFARNVCGLTDAHTTEVNDATPHPVITIMEEQKRLMVKKDYGASMRLGAYDCQLTPGTKSFEAYQKNMISERHRHRFEFNNEYRSQFEEKGLVVAGINPQKNLVEIIELNNHPFFVGTQFHPEFKSRPLAPHPLFSAFVKAAMKNTNG